MKLWTKIAASMGCLAVLMAVPGGYLLMQTGNIREVTSLITRGGFLPVITVLGKSRAEGGRA